MSAPTPTVSYELKALMRKLRLGQLLDTLPERLALRALTTSPTWTFWNSSFQTR